MDEEFKETLLDNQDGDAGENEELADAGNEQFSREDDASSAESMEF